MRTQRFRSTLIALGVAFAVVVLILLSIAPQAVLSSPPATHLGG